jgi:hypothetical protein
MNILKGLPWMAAMLACGSMAMGQGTDASDKMMQAFYRKIDLVGRGGDASSDMTVCVSFPGIVLKPLDRKNQEDIKYVNQLLDVANDPMVIWRPNQKYISKIYGTILDHKIVPDPPALDAATTAKLNEALDKTDPDNEGYKAYRKALSEFNQAAAALDVEKYDNNAAGKGLTASQTTTDAFTEARRILERRKTTIQGYFNTITQIFNNNPGAWWTETSDTFKSQVLSGSWVVATFPRMDEWTDDTGWLKLTFKNSEQKTTSSSSEKVLKVSGDLHVSVVTVTGYGGWEKKMSESLATDNDLEISMEVKRVYIQRPWLEWQVFTDATWGWDDTRKGTVISNGHSLGDGSGQAPAGELPLLCDSFLIARNVTFTSKFFKDYKDSMAQTIKAGGSISVAGVNGGNLRGSYSQTDANSTFLKSLDSGSLTIKDPQLIAYVCKPVPRCPAKEVK